MADASLNRGGTGGGNQPQPSIVDTVNDNQFGVPFSGPVRQRAGATRRRGTFTTGITSKIPYSPLMSDRLSSQSPSSRGRRNGG